MWAVREEGAVCVRHARENVVSVVGCKAMMSYAAKREALAFVYGRVNDVDDHIDEKLCTHKPESLFAILV